MVCKYHLLFCSCVWVYCALRDPVWCMRAHCFSLRPYHTQTRGGGTCGTLVCSPRDFRMMEIRTSVCGRSRPVPVTSCCCWLFITMVTCCCCCCFITMVTSCWWFIGLPRTLFINRVVFPWSRVPQPTLHTLLFHRAWLPIASSSTYMTSLHQSACVESPLSRGYSRGTLMPDSGRWWSTEAPRCCPLM